MRNALLVSVLARKQPEPNCLIIATASSTRAYCTDACSGAIPSLTESPLGKDKWWIKRYSPGVFLGTTPRGETRNLGNGGHSKGPASRPAANSLESLALTMSGFCCAEIRLFAKNDVRVPSKWREKPNLKPLYNIDVNSGSYPHNNKGRRLSIWTGVGRTGFGRGWGRAEVVLWGTKITP